MRYALAAFLLLVVSQANAQSASWDFDKLGGLTCTQFSGLYGTSDYLNASQTLSEYIEKTGVAGERLGSACNQMDYIKAQCSQNHPAHVRDAVRALLTASQKGARLPRIPQCGA